MPDLLDAAFALEEVVDKVQPTSTFCCCLDLKWINNKQERLKALVGGGLGSFCLF